VLDDDAPSSDDEPGEVFDCREGGSQVNDLHEGGLDPQELEGAYDPHKGDSTHTTRTKEHSDLKMATICMLIGRSRNTTMGLTMTGSMRRSTQT
jgi:hypothetical protein